MKYFIDTEFIEGPQKERFPISLFRKQTPNTIDLISIGIVAEDGREYYAISKDFNLKEAWNRYQVKEQTAFEKYHDFSGRREYWIRDKVLKPIFQELLAMYIEEYKKTLNSKYFIGTIVNDEFSYNTFKFLLNRYGKTNKEIAEEIKTFCHSELHLAKRKGGLDFTKQEATPEFYAYYADYDWVVFCWLFGRMIDLPEGFPMYCRDLKQMLDDKPLVFDITVVRYGDN